MITPYYGELLLQPIPMDVGLNFCSHKCAYCFANLNKPDRKAAPQSIVNLLAEFNERETLEARLLQEGFPVMMSNKCDPFANSNYRLTLQILELLAALKIPVAFQTKGGRGLKEALDLIGPSVFYVTITSDDDDTSRRIEPGAPLISERFAMISLLRSRGHRVLVGVNPLVRQWIPDVKVFAKRLKTEGITHVWSEVLHLSKDQINNMSPRESEAIGDEAEREALATNIPPACVDFACDFIEAVREHGIKFGCKHWPEESHVMDIYDLYPKRFATMTQWTDLAWQTMKPGQEFTFREWADFMLRQLPNIEVKSLRHYIHSCSRTLGKRIRFKDVVTFDDILRIIWVEKEHRMNPSRSRAFKKVFTLRDGIDKIYKLDYEGLPVRYFTGRKMERG